MIKKYFLFSIIFISISGVTQTYSDQYEDRCNEEECYKASIEEMISLIIPEGSKIESIEKSEFPGIYKVYFGDLQPLYVSEDGQYFIYGQMFKIDRETSKINRAPDVNNLTDLDILDKRLSLMQEIELGELISFKSKKELYDLTIFTDVDCGYCRKLHNQIEQYNNLGITIRYAAFPRSGLGTESFNKMVGAWCSPDPKKAITNLKNGKSPLLDFCDSQPVAKHYAIGKKVGITGTPAIITGNGELLPGYYSPEDLIKKLKG